MGLLITVEGGEFTGKSSLVIPTLYNILNRCGYETLKSREPGGTSRGEQIRQKIFDRLKEGASQEELARLFNESRLIHLEEVIKPFLGQKKENNRVVVLDRYIDSTIVHQGLEGCASLKELKNLEQQTIGNYYPDLTFLLYFPEDKFRDVFLARKKLALNEQERSKTAWDEVDIDKHLARQRHYLNVEGVYESWGIHRNFSYIDASQHPLVVAKDVLLNINPYLRNVEGNIGTNEERLEMLMTALDTYNKEGNLRLIEGRWKEQESLLHIKRNNSQKER